MERLAASAVFETQLPQVDCIDRRERVRNDTKTWLAESLNGSMRTSFEYSSDGRDLYGEDGGSMQAVFDEAIYATGAFIESNPGLSFELRRRLKERAEFEDMLKMVQDELPNTMVVISDYPPELMSRDEDLGGYNGHRKQTMLRVITRQPGGRLRMTTQSLDGSNRQALEAIGKQMGHDFTAGELLDQRIYRELPPAWQDTLIPNLTTSYDQSLTEQFGGSWHAGIKQTESRRRVDTYAFACSQEDLVDRFTQEKLSNSLGAESLRYKIAATADARYEEFVQPGSIAIQETEMEIRSCPISYLKAFNLNQEIEQAARQASIEEKSFSGCGATVSGDITNTKDQLDQSGYGNKSSDNKNIMKCVNCPKCRVFHEELRASKGKFTCQNKKCGYSVDV